MGILIAETRARLPAANVEVAKAVEDAMGQLMALLARVPDNPVAKPAAAAPATPTVPATPKVDGGGAQELQNAEAAAAAAALVAAHKTAAAVEPGLGDAGGKDDDALSDICDELTEDDGDPIQYDRMEGETEVDRNKRVAKLLNERRKARAAAKRAENRERGRRYRAGGAGGSSATMVRGRTKGNV